MPNPELLDSMMQMGIDTETAKIALYKTGNQSCDAAIAYVFDNPLSEQEQQHEAPESEAPAQVGSKSSSSLESKKKQGRQALRERENDVESAGGPHYKMVFVVNSQLEMGTGKIAAQVAHGALALYRALNEDETANCEALEDWEHEGERCIVLRGLHERHLQDLRSTASSAGLLAHLVQDAGLTEVVSGAITILAIFGAEGQVNAITGDLGLL